jgi:hypothetical protein
MVASILLLLIGFALGYGARELLSHRRRANARKHYKKHPDPEGRFFSN